MEILKTQNYELFSFKKDVSKYVPDDVLKVLMKK